jgi:ADP-ribose pyrophosphatase YjhB (NUDIX family)
VIYRASVENGEPNVVEQGGTTEAVAWIPLADIAADRLPVYRSVKDAIAAAGD